MPGVRQSLTIVMTDDRRPARILGPVAAGGVTPGGREHALRVRAGQDVMFVRLIASALNWLRLLVEGCLLGDIDLLGVKLLDIVGDHHALGVLPWTLADAVACVDASLAARLRGAEIGVPVGAGRAGRLGQRLAVRVGTRQTTKVTALAGIHASHKK